MAQTVRRTSRVLLKIRSERTLDEAKPRLSFAGGGAPLRLTPLFDADRRRGFAIGRGARWYVGDFGDHAFSATGGAGGWDTCHLLLRDGIGVDGTRVEFAEPDFEQQWLPEPTTAGMAFGGSARTGPPEPQNPRYNTLPANDWFRDDNHSQLDSARATVGGDGDRVRIAHLDTGYDPEHATLPINLDAHLQRNFVEDDRPDDATDVTAGILSNPGHGPATLALLAGDKWSSSGVGRNPLGGAPAAHVFPVRVANSVVLFRTSAIARAIDYVTSLADDPATRADVLTMSMGGIASQAWAEAVNRAYDAGVFMVTAAGNNFANLPTRRIVYPARFDRVVAACGVQAVTGGAYTPYADLAPDLMAGNYGPPSKAEYAIAGFTPNVPWARIRSNDVVDFDGGGTSSATPQVAAAAALWIAQNRAALDAYPKAWMRVEAVRKALFDSAVIQSPHAGAQAEYFGNGVLQSADALQLAPAAASALTKRRRDSAHWALLGLLSGQGAGEGDPIAEAMFELELAQAGQRSPALAAAIGDPHDRDAIMRDFGNWRERVLTAVAEEPGLSTALKQRLGAFSADGPSRPEFDDDRGWLAAQRLQNALDPGVATPAYRRIRVYSSDPSATTVSGNRSLAHLTVQLPWQKLQPGPVDDYLEVVDIDPVSGCCYAPVDLEHRMVLAQDGLEPSESDPRFHQQMVYAVARKTISYFEEALGRVSLWSPRPIRIGGKPSGEMFVRRLRIHPHALREANAYYSPAKKALLFGYFNEVAGLKHGVAPGSTVFTCLSYDVVAHETSHALLDGLHRRYSEATNQDMRAFHEAFSDMVALFQHFTHDEALRAAISRDGTGHIDNTFANLAVQFGRSLYNRRALRSAVQERYDEETGEIVVPTLADGGDEPHARGAILVAAVFDAFLDIYHRRSSDLIRIATQGTGILPEGDMHPDLVERLAREAAKSAHHVLRMVIRALDYCPPVSLTFGDFLRAMITGDFDLAPEDKYDYRTAIVSAFRRRGIHPESVRSVSPDSLRWQRPELRDFNLKEAIDAMDLKWTLESDRRDVFEASRNNARRLNRWLKEHFGSRLYGHEECALLGFSLDRRPDTKPLGERGRLTAFEVHSVRPARRIDTAGQEQLDVIVEITQKWRPRKGPSYRGGATWIVDGRSGEIRYCVRKRVGHEQRIASEHEFRMQSFRGLRASYQMEVLRPREPFAMIHREGEGHE